MFVTAYLPLAQHKLQLTKAGITIMTGRFLFMMILCILFDNRDAAIDKIKGLHSLSTDLSPLFIKWLLYVLFGLLFICNFLSGQFSISLSQTIVLQVTGVITWIVYFISLKKQGYYFYYFGVDGLMFLSALLTTMASI